LPSFAPALILLEQKVYNQDGRPVSQTTECDVLEEGSRAAPCRIRLDLTGCFELSGRVAPADSVWWKAAPACRAVTPGTSAQGQASVDRNAARRPARWQPVSVWT